MAWFAAQRRAQLGIRGGRQGASSAPGRSRRSNKTTRVSRIEIACITRIAIALLSSSLSPLAAALGQGTAPQPASAPSAETTWRVVVLNNADYLLPASAMMEQALRETLTREAPHSVEFFGENLDSFRHPGELDQELHALLRKKYRSIRVDLVLARSSAAIDFVRRYGDELWPGVPLIFYNELAEALPGDRPPAGSTGVLIDLDPAETIELARRLHPQARSIYVISGTSDYDLKWKRRIGPLLAALPSDFSVTWLDDRPVTGILDAVARLPENSLVLYTSVMRDAEGKTRTNPQLARKVAEAANAPVYGFFDTYVGTGIVGGSITDFPGQGRAAARLALRVLSGEAPATIPVQHSPPAQCVLDARALERFGVDPGLLPTDCDIRYRPNSLWRDHPWAVIAALIVLAIQSVLISALIIQRRRRRKIEASVQQQRVELAHALRLATIGEMTAAISHEINQPLGAILGNAEVAEMLLERGAPAKDELRKILADIKRDDRRASEVVRRIRALLHKHEVHRETFDLHDLVLEVLKLVEVEAERRRTSLELRADDGPLSVHGDRIQLQQLVINLVINAMDAMVDTPLVFRRVTVSLARRDARFAEIAISDYGHGIASSAHGRLFESFFTTKPKGLGLGLSIVRTIAEAHGGSVRAENNPSTGATFRVTLPLVLESAPESLGPKDEVLEQVTEAQAARQTVDSVRISRAQAPAATSHVAATSER